MILVLIYRGSSDISGRSTSALEGERLAQELESDGIRLAVRGVEAARPIDLEVQSARSSGGHSESVDDLENSRRGGNEELTLRGPHHACFLKSGESCPEGE